MQLEVLSPKEGLPLREITAITQDNNGFIWLGTSQGLLRYDGYQFKTYNTEGLKNLNLPFDNISHLIKSPQEKKLWIVANQHLMKFDTKSSSIELFSDKHGLKGDVRAIALNKKGDLYAVTEIVNQIIGDTPKQYLYVLQGNVFKLLDKVPKKVSWFTNITTDNENNIWWSTINNGISQYNKEGEFITSYKSDSYNWYGSNIFFIECFFDSNNTTYIFPKSIGGVHRYSGPLNSNSENYQRIVDVPENIYFAKESNNGSIWFAGQTSLYRYNSNGSLTDLSESITNALKFTKINALFIDQMEVLWVATDGGIIKIKDQNDVFEKIFAKQQSQWGNTIRGIIELPDGKILAKCENKYDFLVYDQNGNESEFNIKSHYYKEGPLYNSTDIILAQDGMHVYTVGETLLKININSGNVHEYLELKPYLNITDFKPIMELEDHQLVFGNELNNIIIFNPNTETFTLPFKDYQPKLNAQLLVLEKSSNNNTFWAGTTDGDLYQLHASGKIISKYTSSTTPKLGKHKILALHADLNQGVWIGTFGGGLQYLSPNKKTLTIYNENKGLPNNNVTGILPYHNQGYWISTYNGLSYFNKEKNQFQNFYTEDGLSHNEFNYSSSLIGTNGTYYFGGMNGINKFLPSKVLEKNGLPPLQLTQIDHLHANSKKSSSKDIAQTPLIQLNIPPRELYTTVHWTMPQYFKNEKHSYYTKLEGYENDWQYNGNSSKIRYNKLPAGDYILHVKGLDSRGNNSIKNIALPIHVQQIFYKQWWFILLAAMVLFGIIYGIFKYRLQQILAMERLRTRISSDLHDDVGSMLSGLAMQTELLKANASETDKIRLNKIATISRNAVSQMRDLVWSIDNRRETVSHLIDRMQELAEEVLLPHSIDFSINISQIKNFDKKLSPQIKQHCFLIYKEALTNIIKHSDATTVNIDFINKGKICQLIIKDNGSKKEKYHSTGLGLSNMLLRADKLKATLDFNYLNGFGIYLQLPFEL